MIDRRDGRDAGEGGARDGGVPEGTQSSHLLLPPRSGPGAADRHGPGGGAPADGGEGPRERGGALLSVALPGLPQLLAGRLLAGGLTLGIWTACLLVGVFRWERVRGASTGPVDHQLALASLILLGVGAWLWSLRDVQHRDSGSAEAAEEPGLLAGLWAGLQQNRVALAAALFVGGLYLVALLTPLVAPFDPTMQGDLLTRRLQGPSLEHLLGTDQYARDIFSRLLYGARVSLFIGLLAVGIAVGFGTLLGSLAGYLGGWVDALIMRGVDMVMAFPRLVLLVVVIALFQPSIVLIIAILGFTQWPHVTRIVRAEVLSVRQREFVEAGEALGYSRTRIMGRHILPNVLAPIVVAASLGVGDTIILEAVLSFLGLGIQPPTPSWGVMVAEGRNYMLGAWWISAAPGLAIVGVVLAFNLMGDGLRDVLDPRAGHGEGGTP
jgi:peptide/nickel transport system permease protein